MNKEKNMGFVIASVAVIIIISIFSAGFILGRDSRRTDKCISIPDHNLITEFCKSNHFDNGWLSSSSCGVNKVQCHRTVFGYDEYKCVSWEQND